MRIRKIYNDFRITPTNPYLYFAILCFILLTHSPVYAQRFTANADTKEVPLNYTFNITYTVENGDLQRFSPPKFDGFEAMGPSQSTNISVMNGKMNKSVSYTYTLQPRKQGEFNIAPATAIINGSEMKSNAVYIKVIAPAKQPTQQQQNNDPFDAFRQQRQQQTSEEDIRKFAEKNIFVRVIPSKSTLYQGDQLTLSYKLYFRIQYQSLQATKNPSYNGFFTEEFKLPEPDRNTQPPVEEFNGRKYYVQEFKRVSLFPTKSGKISIEPIELMGVVLIEVPDPFFNNPFFTTLQPYEYAFKSNNVELDIKPLPEKNKPATFSGAVGKFKFTAQYDKTKVKVDEPISLKINYTGTGNFKLINAPKLEFPEEFEAYEPKIKDEYENNGSVVTGSKMFEYVLIPQDGGIYKLPKYEFAYFDVDKGDYIKYVLPETTIEVEGKAKISQNVIAFFKREKEDKPKGLYGIRKEYTIKKEANSKLFWALTGLPFLLMLFGFIFRYREFSESELIAMRKSKANKLALRRMGAAKKLMLKKEEQAFYNEVIRALWEYLSDKLFIPKSQLSKENISEQLILKSVEQKQIHNLINTLDTCEQSLFSPIDQEDAMEKTYTKAIECITDLEEHLKKT